MQEPAAKKVKLDNQNDHLSKLPNELIKSIFRLFKPRELANVKQAAHRYNNLGVQVEEEAKATLLARFDDEVKGIRKELRDVKYGWIGGENYFNYSIENVDGNEFDDMINKAKNLITVKSDISTEYCFCKITRSFHEGLMRDYISDVKDRYRDKKNIKIHPDYMQIDFLGNAISRAKAMREYLNILYSVVDKLVKLTLTYHDEYCNSPLHHNHMLTHIR